MTESSSCYFLSEIFRTRPYSPQLRVRGTFASPGQDRCTHCAGWHPGKVPGTSPSTLHFIAASSGPNLNTVRCSKSYILPHDQQEVGKHVYILALSVSLKGVWKKKDVSPRDIAVQYHLKTYVYFSSIIAEEKCFNVLGIYKIWIPR